jgi:two-component system probable response regulator PhcQ
MTAHDPASPATVTVLFVDDEPLVLRAIVRLLAGQAGFDVLAAASGIEALAILRTRSVDVLVSDIDMPRMTGLELVRIARREFPGTLRVLLTGAGTMDRAVKAINEGEVVRFFAKPFEVDAFVQALGELRERILTLRRERHVEAQRERCVELFRWIEDHYEGALDIERGGAGEVVVDVVRLRAYVDAASPEVRAFTGE